MINWIRKISALPNTSKLYKTESRNKFNFLYSPHSYSLAPPSGDNHHH